MHACAVSAVSLLSDIGDLVVNLICLEILKLKLEISKQGFLCCKQFKVFFKVFCILSSVFQLVMVFMLYLVQKIPSSVSGKFHLRREKKLQILMS